MARRDDVCSPGSAWVVLICLSVFNIAINVYNKYVLGLTDFRSAPARRTAHASRLPCSANAASGP